MKNSNIAESVFNVNFKYSQLQNKTEELFFRCLQDNLGIDYFSEQMEKIWGNIDHSFMEEEIKEYSALIYERDMEGKKEVEAEPKIIDDPLFLLVPISVIIGVEKQFKKDKEKEYKRSYESPAYKNDKDEYIKMKLSKYTSDTVPYKVHKYVNGKKTDTVIGYRFVSPSVYNSMIHNTNLVREGWNRTMDDADLLGIEKFFIPYHSFSCPHCVVHQEKKLTRKEIIKMTGKSDETQGDILHPNCKCEIVMWEKGNKIPKSKLSDEEKDEIYKIRQKTNGLTLKKERLKTEMKIAKRGGYEDVVDELNNMRNSINKKIRELQSKLPTEELKKQVTAINRIKIQSSNKYIEQAKRNIQSKANKKIIESKLKTDVKNKAFLKELNKSSMQTHKEMQELFKIRENRPKYMEQLEKKQQELKNIRKIIKQKNNDMKYWKAKQQELSLKVDIKNLKELINK